MDSYPATGLGHTYHFLQRFANVEMAKSALAKNRIERAVWKRQVMRVGLMEFYLQIESGLFSPSSLDLEVARIDANHAASERFGEKTSCLTGSAGDIKDVAFFPDTAQGGQLLGDFQAAGMENGPGQDTRFH